MAGDSYLEDLLGRGEQIILTTRQHWLALTGRLVAEILLVVALLVLLSLISLPNVVLALAVLGLVAVLIYTLVQVVHWTSNKYVVTNRRVIHVSGAVNKNVSSTQLEDISDTRIRQSAMGRLFDYADITILTSSEAGRDRFAFLANPQEFQRVVFDAMEAVD